MAAEPSSIIMQELGGDAIDDFIRHHMGLLQSIESGVKKISWAASKPLAGFLEPSSSEFYDRLWTDGCEPDSLINVLPTHKVIYVAVPKAGSTHIREVLARVVGKHSRSLKSSRRRKFRGPYGPRSMTAHSFFRLATNSQTLRFSFVRNPYARTVSLWCDKFRGKPLVSGDHFIDKYLARRHEIDARLPAGPDRTLSFPDFVTFASAMANCRYDKHIQAQGDILSMPGIRLDLVGKLESFSKDFVRVLDHLGAHQLVRLEAMSCIRNKSSHDHWPQYYTGELADCIYGAYECDFDRFGYPRALPD
jgi:Sulfotransferase family